MNKKYFPILLTLLIFLSFYLISRSISEDELRLLIVDAGSLGPVIFILLSLLTNILAPLSGTPILFAGYYAFGINVIFLATIAGLISFVINFWIARRWGRSIVQKLAGKESMWKIDKLVQNYGLITLILLRLFQGGIGDFVSYAAGLTSMRFWPYIVVSILAAIPGTVLWYYISLQVDTPTSFTILTLLMAAVFSLVFILGSVAFAKLRRRKVRVN